MRSGISRGWRTRRVSTRDTDERTRGETKYAPLQGRNRSERESATHADLGDAGVSHQRFDEGALFSSPLKFRDVLWRECFLRPAVNAPFLHDTRRCRLCSLNHREFSHVATSAAAVYTVELPASHFKEMRENTTNAAAPDDTWGLLHVPRYRVASDHPPRMPEGRRTSAHDPSPTTSEQEDTDDV